MEVVVYVGLAVLGVPEHGVEEGLGGEQRVAEHRPQAPHQLVPGETGVSIVQNMKIKRGRVLLTPSGPHIEQTAC